MRLRRTWVTAVAVLLAATGVAGCSSGSEPSPPAGVDELTIPTPDPQASDFVDRIDNAWLQYDVGAVATFEDGTIWSVTQGPENDGIATTSVALHAGQEAPENAISDFYAQDRAGNVWWLGREFGVGAGITWFDEPGLYLPATPRRGDGWTMAAAPGLDVRARVIDDGEQVVVPAGEYDDAIVLEVVENGVTRRLTYAEGVGLVRINETGLVAHDEPRS